MQSTTLARLGLRTPWMQEVAVACVALGAGFGLMPLLIYFAGCVLLGRYDGASAARLYDSVYQGLELGLASSLLVVFGPCLLYLMFRALLAWWRVGTRIA